MRVKDIMTRSVEAIDATTSIADAARRMADHDIGALPVLSEGKLVGIITDRDIAVRSVGAGVSVHAPVRRVMSESVATCSPNDDVETALALMSREQIRRMPVCNVDEELVGIVTLADAARRDPVKGEVTETLADICEPTGLHCQSSVFA